MSILIKGMNMPDSCFHCKLADVCQHYKAEHYANKRHEDCPLEEVPETHEKRTETHACDCISRKEAIEAVGSMLRRKFGIGGDLAEITLADLPSAQPIDKDTNVLCTDTISRAEAIRVASGYCHPSNVAKELAKLPSVQAEPKWIPVTERLPEPRVAVLGYAPKFKNIFALYYDSVMGWMVWSPIRDDCLPNSQGDIIAWKPLPEPYAERRTDVD